MLDFDTVYREYAPRIRRFVLFLSGDEALADDVTAETFVRVWSTRETVRHDTLRAFLFTIARNLFLQTTRERGRQHELTSEARDPAPGPDAVAIGRIDLTRVRAVLDGLEENDRVALLLRAQEGLSYDEIAQSLRITPAAARVRVHRARRRLQEAMEGELR